MTTSDIVDADDHPKLRDLRERCLDEAFWLALDETDAVNLVDQILDQVIAALRKDPRIPRLSRDDFDLILADVRAQADDQLTRMLDGKASIYRTVECVIETIFAERAGTHAGGTK